jgi:ABC-type glycerol-3-phosphate transport system permease component
MMIPIVGSLPSEIKMAQATGVMNQIWGLWIMRANFLGLYFLVFYDVCKALPTSFSEAAKIDGANNFQIFFQIAMPLIKNTFMTILLIKFIAFWNDYQAAMVFMPSYPTVAFGLNRIMNINADSTRYNHQMIPARLSAVVMTATPVCILFAIFQKRLLGNLTVGGVKG